MYSLKLIFTDINVDYDHDDNNSNNYCYLYNDVCLKE